MSIHIKNQVQRDKMSQLDTYIWWIILIVISL